MMTIRSQTKEKTLIIRLQGELDHFSSAQVKLVVEQELALHQSDHLVWHLAGLHFIDSSGLNVILNHSHFQNKHVTICGLNPPVKKLFQLAQEMEA